MAHLLHLTDAEHSAVDGTLHILARDDAFRRFALAAHAMYRAAAEMGYDAGKINNNGICEMLAAQHLGMRHERAGRGADAYVRVDAERKQALLEDVRELMTRDDELPVELKCSWVAAPPARAKTSFFYSLGRRRTERSARALRRDWLRKGAGGHAWVVFQRSAVVRVYHLSGDFMARLLAEYARLGRRSVNFGSRQCARAACGHFHRAEALARASAEYERAAPAKRSAWNWRAITSAQVPETCSEDAA